MEHPVIYLTAEAGITSLGFSVEACWQEMCRYQSGVKTVDDNRLYSKPFPAAQIPSPPIQLLARDNNLQCFSRLEQLFIRCIQTTICDSNINPADCALIIAGTKGNIGLLDAENETGEELFLASMAEKIARHCGFSSTPIVVCNACISGVSAIIAAKRLIESGVYRNVIVAGGDELSRFVVSGFHAFKSVSEEVCKPYDAARNGLSLGEACGSLLLTADRKNVRENEPVVLLGGSISNDANHISGPSRTGEELHAAITNAMMQAGLTAADISFVTAHGTATLYNDEMESKALHLSALSNTPLQSLKPYLGHTLGASGVIETIFCKKQLHENTLLGTLGFQTLGVPCELNVSPMHWQGEMRYCLKTASGFGGCNAAIVIGKESDNPKHRHVPTDNAIKVISRCNINPLGITLNGTQLMANEPRENFAEFIRKAYAELKLDYRKFYKMDDLSKLGFIAAECLLAPVDDFAETVPLCKGIVAANRSASLGTDIRYRRNFDAVGDREASPAIFVYTLPSVMLGEICIRHNIKGENIFFVQNEFDKDFLMKYAHRIIKEQHLKYCLVGWCDLLGEDYAAEFWLMGTDVS